MQRIEEYWQSEESSKERSEEVKIVVEGQYQGTGMHVSRIREDPAKGVHQNFWCLSEHDQEQFGKYEWL